MEFIRSCIFPHHTIWRAPVRIHADTFDQHNCNCALLDRVNEAIQTYFRKASVLDLTKEELEYLPYELLKRGAKREIHLIWDRLSDHAKKNLEDHRVCEKHPNGEDGQKKLIFECWYCRAERESEEAKAKEESQKY